MLTGPFVTAVGNYPDDLHKPVPISGFYNGNAIAVCINFPHSKQVVALTGNVIDNEREILTL